MRFAPIALMCAALAAIPLAGQVPRPATEFSVNLPGGKALPLQSLRGKVVLLAFIFTTCPHCQHLTPELSAIQRDYAAKGVQVVEVAFNDGVNDQLVREFSNQFNPAFPLGFKDRAAVLTFLRMSILSPLYVPHLVFIDRHGTIRNDVPGESQFMQNPSANIRAELNKLVSSSHSGAASKGKKK